MRAGAVVGVLALALCAGAMELRVATHVGSRFLDKKVDVTVDGDATVGDVKRQVRARFPGAPPVSLQRLFLGSRLLRDDEAAASLGEDEDEDEDEEDEGDDAEAGEAPAAAATKVSLILDVVPPVGDARARPPAGLEDRLRAYAAESVALERVRALLAAELAGDDEEDDDAEEEEEEEEAEALAAPKIAAAVRAHERALLAACQKELAAHAARVTSGVVRDGRGGGRGGGRARDPRRAFFADTAAGSARDRLALGLDVDWRESAKLTAGLCVAANVGVRDAGRKAFLLSLAPLVVLARTRPARFLAKTAWYALPRGPKTADGFFQCLLNAPQQIMLALDEPAYLDELYRPLVADADLAAAAREADEEDYDDEGDADDADADDDEDADDEDD